MPLRALVPVVLVALAWCAAPLAAQSPVDDVQLLEAARRRAMVGADRAALERLLAPECAYTHSTGAVQTRAEVIAMLESKNVRYVSFTTPIEAYHAFGPNTVVITGTQTIALEVAGKPLATTNRFTVVWVRLDESWTCVAYQSTAVPADTD
jgi:hypothetical protein